ncbi:MAG: DUF1176 domain-containing protein [Bacteroidota bacterium]
MRSALAAVLAATALLLAACASPDATTDAPRLGTEAEIETATETATEAETEARAPAADSPDGFDAQAWLAEARGLGFDPETSSYDDNETDRMKALASDLNAAADWRRACDTYLDYETGEMVYDPLPPESDHWVRGTFEIGDLSETEAVVAVTCHYGAYQGSYAFVHIDGDRVAVLSTPELDDGGQPLEARQTAFSTPGFSRLGEGLLTTFGKSRGLGDCGDYRTYALGDADGLTLREVRRRECGDDIPDPLPPPSEWPVIFRDGAFVTD